MPATRKPVSCEETHSRALVRNTVAKSQGTAAASRGRSELHSRTFATGGAARASWAFRNLTLVAVQLCIKDIGFQTRSRTADNAPHTQCADVGPTRNTITALARRRRAAAMKGGIASYEKQKKNLLEGKPGPWAAAGPGAADTGHVTFVTVIHPRTNIKFSCENLGTDSGHPIKLYDATGTLFADAAFAPAQVSDNIIWTGDEQVGAAVRGCGVRKGRTTGGLMSWLRSH
ncbi:hypothetical protein EVAR_13753_1 [Eumeta japonica]|uniref:Uncharacterized protein n=1 Tax=Eumeta variegata TaxID=151549 RepID=A0A4C1UBH6_EUMVA|nr:hypothetical protein EVAR_13753_1 [Eumeta japonica]